MTAAQRPEELRDAVEINLETFETDHLDLVYLRRMDFAPGLVIEEEEQQVPLADQLEELIALRDEGKIRGIGLSHVTREQVEEALPAGIAVISGTSSAAHLKENLAAGELVLPEPIMARLDG